MEKKSIRVRFAPAPTGTMHLGNIRTALMNYLFAQQKNGTFILRIEDTDTERNFDPGAVQIMKDLEWLDLTFDEGPLKGGEFGPYFQSERTSLYQEKLRNLEAMSVIYRCFCSQDELEKKRARQIALKLPPRYDRSCLRLNDQQIAHNLENSVPFVWRVKLDHTKQVTIHDLARGAVTFDLKNFSDFPISRSDGSVTFMFANFVDDMMMRITHVFRGEDHLSNTAGQAALYGIFQAPLPTFWHMPIICNVEGRKLSKRDLCFSIKDLQQAGYLPEAICNYLATIGGSFAEEVMTKQELAHKIDFHNLHASGQIKYDVAKLTWLNHKWIASYDTRKLVPLCRPFIEKSFAQAQSVDDDTLIAMLNIAKTEMQTLKDAAVILSFYFARPQLTELDFTACIPAERIPILVDIVTRSLPIEQTESFVNALKKAANESGISLKELFWFLRLALMGSIKGFAIAELISMLGQQEALERIKIALNLFR